MASFRQCQSRGSFSSLPDTIKTSPKKTPPVSPRRCKSSSTSPIKRKVKTTTTNALSGISEPSIDNIECCKDEELSVTAVFCIGQTTPVCNNEILPESNYNNEVAARIVQKPVQLIADSDGRKVVCALAHPEEFSIGSTPSPQGDDVTINFGNYNGTDENYRGPRKASLVIICKESSENDKYSSQIDPNNMDVTCDSQPADTSQALIEAVYKCLHPGSTFKKNIWKFKDQKGFGNVVKRAQKRDKEKLSVGGEGPSKNKELLADEGEVQHAKSLESISTGFCSSTCIDSNCDSWSWRGSACDLAYKVATVLGICSCIGCRCGRSDRRRPDPQRSYLM